MHTFWGAETCSLVEFVSLTTNPKQTKTQHNHCYLLLTWSISPPIPLVSGNGWGDLLLFVLFPFPHAALGQQNYHLRYAGYLATCWPVLLGSTSELRHRVDAYAKNTLFQSSKKPCQVQVPELPGHIYPVHLVSYKQCHANLHFPYSMCIFLIKIKWI